MVILHEEIAGGATLSVLRTVPILEDRGWRFVFWAARPSPLCDELCRRGLKVHGAPRPIGYSIAALREPPGIARRLIDTPAYLWRLRALVREIAPDVIHANSFFTLAEALVAATTGSPTVLHVHEMVPDSRKYRIGKRLAYRRLHWLVAVSKASAARLAQGERSPRVVYEAAPVPTEPVELRALPRPFVVGTVGVISKRKGSDIFVDAARLIRATGADIQFEMIGACSDVLERTWAEDVLERARVVGVVHREVAEISAAMKRWDAFVLPSRKDPFPIAMLEAMATGLPVIGTWADGLSEQLTSETGLLVEPGSAEALAAAVHGLADQPLERRRSMGLAARRRVQEHFSLERQAEALDGVYRSAIGAAGEG